MVFYIAGPMRNRPYYNFEEFDRAERILLAAGHKAWNPASGDRMYGFDPRTFNHPMVATGNVPAGELPGLSLKAFVGLDLAHLQTCDAIVLLPEWWTSKGARAEAFVAAWLELPCFHISKFDDKLMLGRPEPPHGYTF